MKDLQKEKKLDVFAQVVLVISVIGGIIMLIASNDRYDGFNIAMLSSAIAMIVSGIGFYLFMSVICEISKSLKENKHNNIEVALNQINRNIAELNNKIAGQKSDKTEDVPSKPITKAIKNTDNQKTNDNTGVNAAKYDIPANADSTFKEKVNRWKDMKEKGFIDEAIKEYQDETELDYDFAKEFIENLQYRD